MKASELMINDWVLSLIGTPCRVKIESFVCHDSWEDGNHGAFNFNDVEPIPLTEEILEKNDLPQYEWLKIYFQGEYGNITDFSIKIKYVHQLQHALRLCGRNELADNIKI